MVPRDSAFGPTTIDSNRGTFLCRSEFARCAIDGGAAAAILNVAHAEGLGVPLEREPLQR
jgi:hypothetical protein